MTRRLVISMLLTVWAILIASGLTAYWTTRAVGLANLDAAEWFDRLLNRLAIALVLAGCIGGVIAAFVAQIVARIALRPLHSTAQTIGEIDEKNLARRIDATKLAPELVPVAEKLNEMLERL